MKRVPSLLLILLFLATSCITKNLPGIRVKGRFIVDNQGNKIVLRGVNAMFVYSPDRYGEKTYPEIAKTGANAVRIFWLTDIPAAEAAKNIENCMRENIIPIWSVWDATGKWDSDLQKCVDYWCKPETLEVIKRFEKYLILNIANEPGKTEMPDFLQTYEKAITQLRQAGIRTPLMIDADGWGRNEKTLLKYGKQLLDFDILHNVILSWHAWNVNYKIKPVLAKAVELNLPFVVGEFSEESVGCQCCINYKDILKYCQAYQIGWLAWSWGIVPNGDCSHMDMTDPKNPVFETLHDWGLEVAVTDSFSIKNTSVKLNLQGK